MITDPDDHFARGCGRCAQFDSDACVTRKWAAGLEALRRLCLGAGLVETAKWGHPCYMAGGRNVALIGALNGDFRLNFFEASLMADPAGVMERQGPNTRHPDSIKFTENGQVAAMAATVAAYLAEAKAHAEAGRRAPREAGEVDLPAELAEALEADPELAEAFHALTPGRQRSYVINLAGAKAAQTRIRRIAGFRSRILAGKGAQER